MMGRLSVAVLALACVALGYSWGARGADIAEEQGAPSFLSALTADLNLRPAQVAKIGQLLANEDKDIQALTEQHRRELQGPIAARLDQTVDAMLVLLDDEQRARYHEMTGEQISDR
ncbi:MAG: hypothetical protein ACI9EF_001229 [Pseudohongiellaceae bacterium]|jgi:hypothetical protein